MLSDVPLPLLVPFFVLLGVVFYFTAVLDQTRAENTSTERLRLVVFLSGMAFFCIGALCSHFEVPWRGRTVAIARAYSAADDFLYWMFMFVGVVMVISTPLWSRARLVREARHLMNSNDEFDLSDEDVVTPAERIAAMQKRSKRRASEPENPDKPV